MFNLYIIVYVENNPNSLSVLLMAGDILEYRSQASLWDTMVDA